MRETLFSDERNITESDLGCTHFNPTHAYYNNNKFNMKIHINFSINNNTTNNKIIILIIK